MWNFKSIFVIALGFAFLAGCGESPKEELSPKEGLERFKKLASQAKTKEDLISLTNYVFFGSKDELNEFIEKIKSDETYRVEAIKSLKDISDFSIIGCSETSLPVSDRKEFLSDIVSFASCEIETKSGKVTFDLYKNSKGTWMIVPE